MKIFFQPFLTPQRFFDTFEAPEKKFRRRCFLWPAAHFVNCKPPILPLQPTPLSPTKLNIHVLYPLYPSLGPSKEVFHRLPQCAPQGACRASTLLPETAKKLPPTPQTPCRWSGP